MKKTLERGWILMSEIARYFRRGREAGLSKQYLKAFASLAIVHINNFRAALSDISKEKHKALDKLQKTAQGLHSLLPKDPQFTYSILMAAEDPDPVAFESCLRACCRQTPSQYEILVGISPSPSETIKRVIEQIQTAFPSKIALHPIANDSKGECSILNTLATYARGNYLLIVNCNDWIRPDLLFRYEQTLRSTKSPQKTLLCCYTNEISLSDEFLPRSEHPNHQPTFPYHFSGPLSLRGYLIPRKLWEEVGGIPLAHPGAESLDFLAQLDKTLPNKITIPLPLYSKRVGIPFTNTDYTRHAAINALSAHTASLNLNWQWHAGFRPDDLRAIPELTPGHNIQVIIPFKDQKTLTLNCIHALKKQKGVSFQITAIDNGSADTTIADAIRKLGGEVITIQEPFNYSRLNNLGVGLTKTAQECDLLLFLNNDVDLDEGALVEMCRWIDQPSIGIVGCRLHYPDGKLQHGGVTLDTFKAPGVMTWIHHEKMRGFEAMEQSKSLGIVDAVTAACALVRKSDFLAVGGFDEILYPIAYSDTNLAIKLSRIGLKAFYTPFASGVHHESISRQEGIEDFENSAWLNRVYTEKLGNRQTEYRG